MGSTGQRDQNTALKGILEGYVNRYNRLKEV